MRQFWLWIVMLCVISGTSVQAQGLQAGDSIKGASMFSFGKKMVVLEFWSINCISCIRSFPKLQSLRNQFENDLEVVLVNGETAKAVEDLFAKRKNLFRPSLPFINGDTMLRKQFDDLPLPFQVWIDSTGVIQAITEASELTEAHVIELLKGNPLTVKGARNRKIKSSLVVEGAKEWNAKVNYYSYLADCSNNISVGYSLGTPVGEGKVRLSKDCVKLLELYKVAFSEKGKFNFYHPFNVKINVADPQQFENGRYSYDLTVPSHRASEIFTMMQQDLERYYGLKAAVSRSYCKVLELTAQPGPNLLGTMGDSSIYLVNVEGDLLHVQLRDQPFDTLVNILRRHLPASPLLLEDRSSYRTLGNIDISLRISLEGKRFMESLIGELGRYNLKVYIHDIPMDVLSVTDK